jgi:hypothetical protein
VAAMSRLVIQGRIGINKPFSYFERRNFIMKESWREQVFNKRLRAIFNSLLLIVLLIPGKTAFLAWLF